MNRLRKTVTVVVALVLITATGAVAKSTHRQHAGTLNTVPASDYTSNGASISGWNWLRASGNTASWTFNVSGLQAARNGSVYLNLNPLATKGVSGGSGWSGSLTLVMTGASAKKVTLSVNNPFRPRSSTDSAGVGYQAYGAIAIPASVYRGVDTITVKALRSKASVIRDIHLATNEEAAVIGYLKTPIVVYAMK